MATAVWLWAYSVGYAGFDAARETLNPLLGQPPAHEFVEKIDEIVMSHSEVCGMHASDRPRLRPGQTDDLIACRSSGRGKYFGTA